jgi:hypothetical protein
VPYEDLSGSDEGGINILYGSPAGLTTAGSAWLDQVIVGLPDSAEDDDYFGRVLAVLEASRHTVYLPLTLRQVPQP